MLGIKIGNRKKKTRLITNLEQNTGTNLNILNVAGWAASSGTVEQDNVNVLTGSGIKITNTGQVATPASIITNYTLGTDVTDNIIFDLYIEDITKFAATIYLMNSATDFYSLNFSNRLQAPYWWVDIKNGMNTIKINKADFTKNVNADWLGTFYKFQLRLSPLAGTNTTCTISNLRYGHKTIPKILLTGDDGFATQSVMDNYLTSKGLRATYFLISDTVQGTNASYARLPFFTGVYNKGNDVCNHTKTHQLLTPLSEADITTEIQTCKTFLSDNGFLRASDWLACPQNSSNALIESVATSLGYNYSFSRTAHYNRLPILNKLGLYRFDCGNGATYANIKAMIDSSIAKGMTLILMMHNVVDTPSGANDISTAIFQQVIDYLASLHSQHGFNLVVTASEYESQYNSLRIAA